MATDWPLEIFKVAATGLFAFGGAFLAFRFASIGRKQDILFKEKYKNFEKVVDGLFDSRHSMREMTLKMMVFRSKNISTLVYAELTNYLRDMSSGCLKISEQLELYQKHMILTSLTNQIKLQEIQSIALSIAGYANEQTVFILKKYEDGDANSEFISQIIDKFILLSQNFDEEVKALILSMYKDQNLPEPAIRL